MLRVVKIGGHVIDSPELLHEFLTGFSRIEGPKILVHGGGKDATRMAEQLGIENKIIEGRRITDAAMLEVVIQSFTKLNINIVSQLQQFGTSAIGLSGADFDCIRAKKRSHPEIDYGFVGDIVNVNFEGIQSLLHLGMTPVFCALTHDGNGQLLNTNADTIASSIAQYSTLATELIYCFEKGGVLKNENDEKSVMDTVSLQSYKKYLDTGIIHGGMKPKLDNAFDALNKGVLQVRITHYSSLLGGTQVQL